MTTHETERPVDESVEEVEETDEQLDPGIDTDTEAEPGMNEPVEDEPDTAWSREPDAVDEDTDEDEATEPEFVEAHEADELTRPDLADEADEPDAVAAGRTSESDPREKLTPVGPESAMDPGAGSYEDRWGAIQTGFIDDPRRAAESASALVREIWDEIERAITAEREGIDDRWTPDSSTDDLRAAMQDYRTLYTRFLRFT